jgi:hypothetical protein
MDHQKLILDKLTGILAVTDNKSAQLLDLVEKAVRERSIRLTIFMCQ